MSLETSLELNVIIAQIERHCAFSLGKKRIREITPSFNRLIIERDLASMREALSCIRHVGPMPFAGIRDLEVVFQKAEKGSALTANDLLNVIQFIRGIRGMIVYEKSLQDVDHENIRDLTDTLIDHKKTEQYLTSSINEYGEVMDSASSALKSIRNALHKVDGEIYAAVNRFMHANGQSVVDGIVTYRNDRAVVLVKASDKNSFGGLVYGDSSSGQTSYIEPPALMAVNNKKQQLLAEEREEVSRILAECTIEVGKIAREALANLETATILDAIFAKAAWGAEHDACAASLCDEQKISIIKARHPLIDEKKVVANSYHLEDPKKLLLITGPNTGGKTVSMKIIGLFVLMTYCGMPVTAESAELPYFDAVFADIGDDQSVVESLSSFSSHIRKQAEVCAKATEHSLVLLDEVGSGTDPREGESLAIAILNHLREIGCMAVVTTHYGRLKTYGKRHEDILLASVQFDMEKLQPTYRYMEGLSGQSNAFEVAEKYGLPKDIIKYARFLKNQAKTKEEELLEQLEKQIAENEQLKEKLTKAIDTNQTMHKQLQKEKQQLSEEKETILSAARTEAASYLEETKNKADELLKEIRSRKNEKYHEVIDLRHQIEEIEKPEPEETDGGDEIEYHVGDAVELKNSTQVCEIIKIGRKDMTILINGREMRVKKNQIRPSRHVIPKMKKQETATINISSHSMFSTMPLEVNLIGLRVDEGMEKLSAYVDEAKVHGLKTFRVIHGDGTGKLRKAVHAFLDKDSSVKNYRLGVPGEGGTGATVVELK